MSSEALEGALLKKITSGDVTGNIPSMEQILQWTPIQRAQALADIASNLSSNFHPGFADVIGKDEAKNLVNVSLARLGELGWDGKTLENFNQDLNALKEVLKTSLPPEEWEKYFG